MIQNKKVLAIIPARGGSKGLPKKNIKVLAGKPLIAWTIEAGKNSKYIDRLILSSDCEEIISVAKSYGCEVPFIRPVELSVDTAASMDVILHAINFFKEKYDICVMLEPTSPLRDSEDIDLALEQLVSADGAESIIGICKVESGHPVFLVFLEEGMIRSYLNNNFKFFRRQDINDLYFFEGSLYISYISSLIKRQSFYHNNCLGYIVPKWKSFEIDDIIDFMIIENLLIHKMNGDLK